MYKVVKVNSDSIEFEGGILLYSDHLQDCCENHWLDFSNLSIEDFDGLEFDLDTENFFEHIENYGIALSPVHGLPVRVPGYGSNNGYYSSDLDLVLSKDGDFYKSFDITECQEWKE